MFKDSRKWYRLYVNCAELVTEKGESSEVPKAEEFSEYHTWILKMSFELD